MNSPEDCVFLEKNRKKPKLDLCVQCAMGAGRDCPAVCFHKDCPCVAKGASEAGIVKDEKQVREENGD